MMCRRFNVFGAALLALLATVSVANAQLTLVPNGDFSTPGGVNWGFDGPAIITFETTGGNTGGYAKMDESAGGGWGVLVSDDSPLGVPLSTLGLTAGQNYDFTMDMINLDGTGIGGLKLESWDTGHISNTGDVPASGQSSSWATYTWNYTIDPAATSLKLVPLWGPGSVVGFDNLGVVVPEPASIGLLSLAGLMIATRRRRK